MSERMPLSILINYHIWDQGILDKAIDRDTIGLFFSVPTICNPALKNFSYFQFVMREHENLVSWNLLNSTNMKKDLFGLHKPLVNTVEGRSPSSHHVVCYPFMWLLSLHTLAYFIFLLM